MDCLDLCKVEFFLGATQRCDIQQVERRGYPSGLVVLIVPSEMLFALQKVGGKLN
ncbi:hypothetical protein [Geomonas sp. Red32]|uniref:hypothetical protein n=1 Tax=Geomonas sp. Red32 TaxID=2912856 RepID=UPI00202D0CBC|nr:hypothetical protein [Geomonas sp. Red32]